MNPQDPLAALQPLREPELISWWPLAYGWWLLGGLILLVLVALTVWLVRRYRANAYRRRALARLQVLQQAYERDNDQLRYLTGINALLKSVALVAYPRREIAASSGDKWLTFLNSRIQPELHFEEEFASAVYREACQALNMEKIHTSAQHWIRRHEVLR